jgi:hypothetical protein
MPELLPIELLDKAMEFALEEVYVAKLAARTPKESRHTSERWKLRRNGMLDYSITNDVLVGEAIPLVEILDLGHKKQFIRAKHRTKAGNPGFLRFEVPRKQKSKGAPIPGNVAFEKDGFVFTRMVRGMRGTHFITETLADKSNQKLFENFMTRYIERALSRK